MGTSKRVGRGGLDTYCPLSEMSRNVRGAAGHLQILINMWDTTIRKIAHAEDKRSQGARSSNLVQIDAQKYG